MFSISRLMKAAFAGFLGVMFLSTAGFSQSCPTQGTQLFPNLSGQELIDELVAAYGTTDNISYDSARDILYSEIDLRNDSLTGIYTGYTIYLDPNADPSSDAFSKDVNAEHSWPQSKGASAEPARSDMHHLFPAYSRANSARGNHPYYEIPDEETDTWWRLDQNISAPEGTVVDEYSEYRDSHPNTNYAASWEPREDAKGDVARASFYFYTMYKSEADAADPIFFEIQKDFLRGWNSLDAVSDKEYQRTCAIAEISGNEVNPFVIDPTLVDRAYFEGQISQTNVEFSASILTFGEGQGTVEIDVSISNPNADTATTVDVVYSGGTATSGDDFDAFTTQTLTFPAGSLERQSISINLVDDELEEGDETITLALENPTGPENVTLGQASSTEITIRDNDGEIPTAAWINEFHYDNDGGDQGEFVELAVNAEFADLSTVNLTLYNGNGGSSYDTYSGDDFIKGGSQNGVSFYYVDLPTNGLQNGSPDGFSLDIDGELIQFLSYEGTFSAADGPAENIESTDIGIEQPGTSPIGSSLSLAGTGTGYDDFTWEFTEVNSKGEVNENQTVGEDGTDPEPSEPVIVQFTEATVSLFEDEGTATVNLGITNPNPDTASTVKISRVGGTATEDEDFEAIGTQSLTFAAGSSQDQSFDISISDDDLYEKNETIVFAIQSVHGPAATEIGTPDTLTVTITNDDKNDRNSRLTWINEIHYQNVGPDSNEFVEFVNVGIPVKQQSNYMQDLTLTLYNGETGKAYASFSGDDIKESEQLADSGGGFAIFYHVDISGLQNGEPDGISLTYQDGFHQFLSYGGSFPAVDGPAKDHQSEDIGIIESEEASASMSLSLKGSGYRYSDFEWVVSDSSTKGSLNSDQNFDIPSSNEEETELASNYKLNQNYPNPFNPTTVISYQLAENSTVRLQVFDMLGREVTSLINGERKTAGSHQITFDAGNLSSGVYIYRLSTNSGVQLTRKMLLMK